MSMSLTKKDCAYLIRVNYPNVFVTDLEVGCLHGLISGLTNQEIGEQLNLHILSVGYYIKNLQVKLACKTPEDLVRAFRVKQILTY